MSNAYPGPLAIGDVTLNSQENADLGKTYGVNNLMVRLVQTNSLAISKAGGKLLQRLYTLGVPTGQVIECVTANSYDICGVVPVSASQPTGPGAPGITTATAISPLSYFLAIVRGPAVVQANTTVVGPTALFGASGTTGGAQSVDSTTGLFGSIMGQITATAVATAANNVLTCIMEIIDG